MTKAYVVQVKLPEGTKYLSAGGKLSKIPKFFTSWASIKHTIGRSYSGSNHYYGANHHNLTTVYVVTQLEASLETSRAEKLTYAEFMSRDFYAKPTKSNPNSVFKIQRADGSFVNIGSHVQRHGKTWNRAGDLRAHLSSRMREWSPDPFNYTYRDAHVVEIEYPEDRSDLIPVRIIKHDILTFYKQSPTCRQRYEILKKKGIT